MISKIAMGWKYILNLGISIILPIFIGIFIYYIFSISLLPKIMPDRGATLIPGQEYSTFSDPIVLIVHVIMYSLIVIQFLIITIISYSVIEKRGKRWKYQFTKKHG